MQSRMAIVLRMVPFDAKTAIFSVWVGHFLKKFQCTHATLIRAGNAKTAQCVLNK